MRWDSRRAAAIVAVCILHTIILAGFLSVSHFSVPPREILISLSPLPREHIVRKEKPAGKAAPRNPIFAIPPPANAAPDSTALEGLGRTLACSGDLERLSPEERERCAEKLFGAPDHSVEFQDRTGRIPGAARWARERTHKNAPVLLPCASSQGIGVSIGTLFCIGKGLVEGFKPLDQRGYFDKPEETHIPNGGDPPPPGNLPLH